MRNPADVSNLTALGWSVQGSGNVEQTRLDQAWRALVAELPDTPARITTGRLDEDIVVDVITAAALRVLSNPEGRKKASTSIDDYREDWELEDSSNDLYFTAAELRRLRGPTPPPIGAGSMAYS